MMNEPLLPIWNKWYNSCIISVGTTMSAYEVKTLTGKSNHMVAYV